MRLVSRTRLLHRVAHAERRAQIVLADEAAVHVAGADAHLQHHRRVRRLRERKTLLHQPHDAGQVRSRIEQPQLRLHRERVAALLHDRRAFAVILADHDQRAARHPAGGEVGKRVGRDVGADRRFERDRAAQRIVDRRRQHRRRRRFGRRTLEMHAEFVQRLLRVRQHVHQVRNRRPLVAADIRHPRFQQRLGDREDALAAKGFAGAEAQRLHRLAERSLGHLRPAPAPARGTDCRSRSRS